MLEEEEAGGLVVSGVDRETLQVATGRQEATDLASLVRVLHRGVETQRDLLYGVLPVLMGFECLNELVLTTLPFFKMSLHLLYDAYRIFLWDWRHIHLPNSIIFNFIPRIEVNFDGTIEEGSSEMKERFRD